MPHDNDLIERYLYAITRRLPAAQRSDVASELRTLISDMLDERCGPLPPTPKDIRVVLTELGTPGEMVRKYTDGEGRCLIGQPYYMQYLFVLKIVLICSTGGIFVASLVAMAAEGQQDLIAQVFPWLGTWFTCMACAFSFVTLLFAFFSHKGIEVEVMGSLDDLPPVPRNAKASTRGDAVAGIVFAMVGAFVFLVFPEVLNARSFTSNGVPVEVFNVEAIRASAWVILAWTLICVAGESFKLVEGRYTPRLFLVTCVVDVLAAVLVLFWLSNFQLIDVSQLVELVASLDDEPNSVVLWAFSNGQMLFCALVMLALGIDVVDEAVKTFRGRGQA